MEKNANSKTSWENSLQIWSSNLDFDELKFQIKTTFKSTTPWSLYMNAKKFKEQISSFINQLTNEIVKMFDLNESKTSIANLYIKAEYHKILSIGIQEYIHESKYFDLIFYFYAICLLNKEKQYFAKALLKLYIGKTDKDLTDFLTKYKQNEKIKLQQVKEFYNKIWIKNIQIPWEYLLENDIHKFLEKVYLWTSWEKRIMFMNFFKVGKISNDFEDIYKLFTYITSNYLRFNWDDGPNKKRINNYINNIKLAEEKLAVDSYIDLYWTDKEIFYDKINQLLNQDWINKWDFWVYIKTSLINKYFPQVKELFYWELINKFIWNRLKWNSLSWNINLNDESIYSIEIYNKCDNFKKLIIQLQNNIWWPFLKPVVYRMITEHLKVDKKSFEKLQFIMCFITAKDYSEYKTIYRFFSDVKNIYWFYDHTFSTLSNYINRIKISFSLILLFIWLLVVLFKTAPIIVFSCVALLWLGYLFDFVSDDKIRWIEWNTWFRSFLIFALILSWFTWFVNLWKTLENSENLVREINKYSTMTLADVMKDSSAINISKHYADLLNKYKNKEINWLDLLNELFKDNDLKWIIEKEIDNNCKINEVPFEATESDNIEIDNNEQINE